MNNQKLKEQPTIDDKEILISFVRDDVEIDGNKKRSILTFPSEVEDSSCTTKDAAQVTTSFLRRLSSFSDVDKPKKRVNFGSLEVREHKITLGDHPDYVDLGTKDL